MASIGQVSNIDHENVKIGKAGRKRHMGWRPTVRGSVMNPNDTPTAAARARALWPSRPCNPLGQGPPWVTRTLR